MADLNLSGLVKDYDKTRVLFGIDLSIKSGEFVVFVGPSGCGKSTLLRMIAGLEEITAGTLSIDDEIVNDVVPAERGVSMVFQSYALYPHMTVYDNMAFGLRQNKTPKAEIDSRVRSTADILQIASYLQRLPKHLSGGQRQRVAIGRAIVRDPKVFLFDEPLSNLDAALRVQTRIEIAKLHEQLDATMIYVTHDQVEAMTLADRIVVLNEGRIEQVGSPLELYNAPINRFVAEFIGSPKMNVLPLNASISASINASIRGAGMAKTSAKKNASFIGVRPEHFEQSTKAKSLVSGKVRHIEQLGEYALAYIGLGDGAEITAKLDSAADLDLGSAIHLAATPDSIHLFDANSQAL